MTSNGSTLVECPPKNEELLLSEIYKHPPCVPYKRGSCLKIQVRAKPSKRLLHVNRSCVGLSPHCYPCKHSVLLLITDIIFITLVFLRRRCSFTSRKLYVSIETFLCFFFFFINLIDLISLELDVQVYSSFICPGDT